MIKHLNGFWSLANTCFRYVSALFLLHLAIGTEFTDSGVLLCKNCGEVIAAREDLRHVSSSASLKQWNQTLLGVKAVPIQLFQNPQGHQFNVITFSSTNAKAHEETFSEATWFEGYSWKISVCPKCGIHLGWKYQPKYFNHLTNNESDTFHGIILERLLDESSTDSILLEPNSYRM